MKFSRALLTFLIALYLISCNNTQEKPVAAKGLGKNEMADLNRYLVQKDRDRIISYIERKNLKMTETATGLWYQILNDGSGKPFGENDKVKFNYECSLLDGTKCYSSAELGPKEVVLGKSTLEQGLNEGFRLMKPGGSAIFIIPPFLAYGFVGDRKMIPPRAVIVYNVNILQLE